MIGPIIPSMTGMLLFTVVIFAPDFVSVPVVFAQISESSIPELTLVWDKVKADTNAFVEVEANRYQGTLDDMKSISNNSVKMVSDEALNRARRDYIVKMMKHAWQGYSSYAWGKNEVRPVSKRVNFKTVFGFNDAGATIVDAMDTLFIMGLKEDFELGRKWIASNLNVSIFTDKVNMFEVNIRYVGSLLSLYALTGDEMFKLKAIDFADSMLPAFDTPTGLPIGVINLSTGEVFNDTWSHLSEMGTLHLEFSYLSEITGVSRYKEVVEKARRYLYEMWRPHNLYPNFVNPFTGQWGEDHSSVGALGDSFYEYLLKEWIRTGKTDHFSKRMFDEAVRGIEEKLLHYSKRDELYLAERRGGMLDHKMDHLACFAGGMFGLAAKEEENEIISLKWMSIAQGITETCRKSYDTTVSRLGPEVIRFDNTLKPFERSFLLRPETVESYFIMWRLTKDNKYRDWGWDLVNALELNCKVGGGYSGIRNVNHIASHDDVQQSFFLAETLKYLFLLFSQDNVLSLDDWVFNTEAHPLPIEVGVSTIKDLYVSTIRHVEL